MEEEVEYKKLPLEDRCVHKLWKARLDGYEECVKHFNKITDEKSPEFIKFAPHMKKFVTDGNAVALDKALDAVSAYVAAAHIAHKTAADVTAGIVTKCLAAPKKTTQDKALEILLLYCEIEKFDVVLEEIMKGFSQKNPKVVAGCVRSITAALRNFGNKVISIKQLVKSIGPLLEDRDKNVREEAKKMVIEMYRWAGPPLNPQLSNLKPVQLQELEAEFQKLGSEKAIPTRYLRSQQEQQARILEGGGEADDDEADGEADEGDKMDPMDLVDEVNILEKMPKDFYEMIEAKKWQDRKKALEDLLPLSQNTKLETGNYGDLVKALKKVIGKDTNVVLVALAGNCLADIAKGLRKGFSPYAIACIDVILGKFKEKKVNVVTSMREAIDAVYQSTNIEAILETVVESLKTKNPNVKAETASFVARSFCYCTPTMLNKKLLKAYVTEFLKTLNESDPIVRDSSAEALGTALKVVGEKNMNPLLADVDPLKMAKITEYSQKAEIKVKIVASKSKPKPKEAPQKKAVRGGGGREPKQMKEHKEAPPEDFDDDLNQSPEALKTSEKSGMKRPGTATKGAAQKRGAPKKEQRPVSASRPGSKTSSQKEPEDTGPLLQNNNMKSIRAKDEQRLRTLKWDFATPRAEFINQLKDQMEVANMNPNLVINMFHADFKFHLKAIENLHKDLPINGDACVANLDLILRWLTIRFFDTNPSVIIKAMEYLKQVFDMLADINYKMMDYEATSFLPFLIQKFGDSKDTIRLPAQYMVTNMCNIYPASKISSYILDGLKSKNARQRSVCLETLGSLIENVGMSVCQPTPSAALKEVAKQIADRDNTVRTAALNCLVQVYRREGEKVYKYVGTLSAKDMSLLEERIKRSQKNKPVIKKVEEEPMPVKQEPPPKESKVNRVIPTAAKPAPVLTRGKPKQAEIQNSNSTSRFNIDYDFIERLVSDDAQNGNDDKINVNLEEIHDYDSIMKDYSQTKSSIGRSSMSPKQTSAVGENASEAINLVIAQVSTPDINSVIIALAQLDEVVKSEIKNKHLQPHIDQLLMMVTVQFKHILNTKLNEDCGKEEGIRVYRSLINCLTTVFDKPDLGTRATRGPLCDLINVIIVILLNTKLNQHEDGSRITKALNILVHNIIEKGDFTQVFTAFLKLLRESVQTGVDTKFTELVMKCNWKAMRKMSSKKNELEVTQVLQQLHDFMQAYPTNTWADRPSNMPLKTVKTVMHDLTEHYGQSILNYLDKIPHVQGSEMYRYILKALNTKKPNKKPNINTTDNVSTKSQKRLSKAMYDDLSEIFSMIGSKETKDKGLLRLYEFKKTHPEVDLDSCMKNSSQFFQHFIERGLQKIETDRQKEEKTSISTDNTTSDPISNSTSGAGTSVNDLVDQFKAIAMQAGFDNTYIQTAVQNIYSKPTD